MRSLFAGQDDQDAIHRFSEKASDLLELIHTDVCGPMSSIARGGFQYFITFTDDLSRYGYVYLMMYKSETFEKFKEFQSEVKNQCGKKIKLYDLIVEANI